MNSLRAIGRFCWHCGGVLLFWFLSLVGGLLGNIASSVGQGLGDLARKIAPLLAIGFALWYVSNFVPQQKLQLAWQLSTPYIITLIFLFFALGYVKNRFKKIFGGKKKK